MMRNLAASLFLTERDDEYYEGLTQADGVSVVNPPAHKGRVTTTLQKAKEVRPLVEKCITIAKKAQPALNAAAELASDEDRNSAAWKSWREGDGWKKWNAAIAPAVTARRRAFSLLRDKDFAIGSVVVPALAVKVRCDPNVPNQFADGGAGYFVDITNQIFVTS